MVGEFAGTGLLPVPVPDGMVEKSMKYSRKSFTLSLVSVWPAPSLRSAAMLVVTPCRCPLLPRTTSCADAHASR